MPDKTSPLTTMLADQQKGESRLALDHLIAAINEANFRLVFVTDDDDDDDIPDLIDFEEDPKPCCRHCRTCYPVATVKAKL
ncbi:hypothetical protein C8R44DRAFT_877181 [Mycena epipterygia]|nr:hypothetical protein C8R44DRAFT_877181 [Mycena epipterygia]